MDYKNVAKVDMINKPVLEFNSVKLDFIQQDKSLNALNDISITVGKGEKVALIGESGCGKTLTALSSMGLAPKNLVVSSGKISINNEVVNDFTQKEWNYHRSNTVSMIFQEPMTALNPLIKVGKQIRECALKQKISKSLAKQKALEIMSEVGLSDVENLYNCYAHQLSGGMKQRIMIAMALINNPSLLIADEPTTALDVTVQNQILNLINDMNEKKNTALLLISHDIAVVRHICDKLYIMYAGYIVEYGKVEDILSNPLHPYTKALLSSIPQSHKKGQPLSTIEGVVLPLEQRKSDVCPFYDRCMVGKDICTKAVPTLKSKGDVRGVRCYFGEESL